MNPMIMGYRATLVTAVVLWLGPLMAQTTFPNIHGETAEGKSIDLPGHGKEFTILGLAYSAKAQPALEEWFEPAYLRFVAKHGLFAGAYQCDVYFVPLFTGLNKAAYEPSMRKFRKSAEPEILDHVIFSKDDLEPLRTALALKDKDTPYFFILDRDGRVLHRTEGRFTEEKLEAMEEVLLK